MSETPLAAMERFGSEMRAQTDILHPIGKTATQITDDAFNFLRPFLSNPEGHEKAIKLLLRGFAINSVRVEMEPLLRILRSPLGKFSRVLSSYFSPTVDDQFSKAIHVIH
jgi:hypothetical protein